MTDAPQFNAELPAKAFADALARLAAITPSGTSIPILTHALLRFGDGGALHLAATNMDHALDLTVEAAGAGAVTASAARLAAASSKLAPDEPIKLATDNHLLVVSQGRTRYRLPTLPAEDFPAGLVDPLDDCARWQTPASAMARYLRACEGAINADDVTRPYLCGAYFDLAAAGNEALFATDGNRLAMIDLAGLGAAPEGQLGGPGIIVPAGALATIMDMAKRHEALDWSMNANACVVAAAGERFRTKLCAGTYPDARRLVPAERRNRYRLSAAGLRQAVERCAVIEADTEKGKGRYTALRLYFQKDEVALSARNGLGEEAAAVCPCKRLAGGDQAVILAAGNLAWAMDSLGEADACEIAIEDEVSPVLVTRQGDKPQADVRLLMPRRA